MAFVVHLLGVHRPAVQLAAAVLRGEHGDVQVHDQFAQKHPIPKNGGKTIEFRKYNPLPKALVPLSEGVTPDGRKMSVTNLTATVDQYGDYIELSDILLLTAIDNNMVQATKLIGTQAGETLDTITREVINGGTNVLQDISS